MRCARELFIRNNTWQHFMFVWGIYISRAPDIKFRAHWSWCNFALDFSWDFIPDWFRTRLPMHLSLSTCPHCGKIKYIRDRLLRWTSSKGLIESWVLWILSLLLLKILSLGSKILWTWGYIKSCIDWKIFWLCFGVSLWIVSLYRLRGVSEGYFCWWLGANHTWQVWRFCQQRD